MANTPQVTWVNFRHWNNFPLVSDLATLPHHHYPDNFPLVSLPSSCFHFTPPFFLHGSGTGEELVRLQRLRKGFLPWDSNGCSCKAGAAKASSSVLQKFDVLMWGSQRELQPTFLLFLSSTSPCRYVFVKQPLVWVLFLLLSSQASRDSSFPFRCPRSPQLKPVSLSATHFSSSLLPSSPIVINDPHSHLPNPDFFQIILKISKLIIESQNH